MHNRPGLSCHTRLTNAHSKSLKHHVAMQAIFVAFYILKSPIAAGNTFNHLLAGLGNAGTSVTTFLGQLGK